MSTIESTEVEVWKPVVGYEEWYQVSNRGNVRRHPEKRRPNSPDVLAPGKQISGHLNCNLCVNGKSRVQRIHRMVAEAFLGPPPRDGMHVLHGDGNPENNAIENLRWGTPQENSDDRSRHGRVPFGSKHKSSVLTEHLVIEMRAVRRHLKWTYQKIATMYGVGSRRVIERACKGESWSHVPNPVKGEQ